MAMPFILFDLYEKKNESVKADGASLDTPHGKFPANLNPDNWNLVISGIRQSPAIAAAVKRKGYNLFESRFARKWYALHST